MMKRLARNASTKQSRAIAPAVNLSRAHVTRETGNATPPASIVQEAKRAKEASWDHPLHYMMGEPLPGRSALDKMRR